LADPDYVAVNREQWTRANADYTDAAARGAWEREEVLWGQWHRPDSEFGALADVVGKDVVELGCGTGYFGAALKRRGARRVVGVDITPAQLETARRMNEEFGLGLEFLEENAEHTSLPDDSFDLVVSEYGASIWCDTRLWIAEASRLLRRGGELVFMRGSTLRNLCTSDDGATADRLLFPQRGFFRIDWQEGDEAGTEFHAPTMEMFQILRENGFELIDFHELYAPEDAEDHPYYTLPAEWAKKWPAEEIWRARLRS
jgi:ubiquinone/menaquinone biosynthesis C-methylase UbiE